MAHDFHILDVFATRPLEGNQLAVVGNAGDLSTEEMQAIALETNYSETTFITGPERSDGSFPVRIFTPASELPFAGHPTLGTAWLIRHQICDGAPDRVVLSLGVGQIPVTFDGPSVDDRGYLLGPQASFGESFSAELVAGALGLRPSDIATDSPSQSVTAGIDFVIVPLSSAEALSRARLDLEAWRPLAERGFKPCAYLFCHQPFDPVNDLSARLFFDANGVREDPATGSATNAVGHYLLHHGLFPEPFEVRIEQGVQMGRPSELIVRGRKLANGNEVLVGGRVFQVVRGELL